MSAASAARTPDGAALRRLAFPMVGLLVVEFLLGMSLNLFLPLAGTTPLEILVDNPILVLHFVVGFLLLGITSRATFYGARLRMARPLTAAGLGLASAVVAFLAGLAFTFGEATAAASFVMSAGFAGLLVSAILLRVPGLVPEPGDAGPAGPAGGPDRGEVRS